MRFRAVKKILHSFERNGIVMEISRVLETSRHDLES